MNSSQHFDDCTKCSRPPPWREARPERVPRSNVDPGNVRWVLAGGTVRVTNIDTIAAELGYSPNLGLNPFMIAGINQQGETQARGRPSCAYAQRHVADARRAPRRMPASSRPHPIRPSPLGGLYLHRDSDLSTNSRQITTNNAMFQFGNNENAQNAPGFVGVDNAASLSFAIAVDATATTEEEQLAAYAAAHGDIALAPTTSLGNTSFLGGTASSKHEGLTRSEDEENAEPQWAVPDRSARDVITDTASTSLVIQNETSTSDPGPPQNETIGDMPDKKITIKLLSAAKRAKMARDKLAVAMEVPTAEEIKRDMPPPMTDCPDRPPTPCGGSDYEKNLNAPIRMDEKYRLMGDDLEAIHPDLVDPCYNEADYENPGTPPTPGHNVEFEDKHKTYWTGPVPTNFWSSMSTGAVPEWKEQIGVDSGGWAIYAPDTTSPFTSASVAPSTDAPKPSTPCALDTTKTCNHALCLAKLPGATPAWSPFSAMERAGGNDDRVAAWDEGAVGWNEAEANAGQAAKDADMETKRRKEHILQLIEEQKVREKRRAQAKAEVEQEVVKLERGVAGLGN